MYIYTIYDKKADTHHGHWTAPTNVHALRTVAEQVNTKTQGNHLNTNPEDFELKIIGEYNDKTGVITPLEHEILANCESLKAR